MIFLISVVICYNFKLLLMIFVGVSKKIKKPIKPRKLEKKITKKTEL
jgi:hypothetical protein